MTFSLSEGARKDLIDSEEYYDQQYFGLGLEFLDEGHDVITRICESPEIWQIIYKDVRRCYFNRFPFHIIYRIREKQIEIIAIDHNKRKPNYWKK